MPYNIEEEQDYLKNNSPYEMNEADWQAMRERVKANALAAAGKTQPSKIRLYWKIAAVAAGLCFVTGICFTYWPAQKTLQTGNVAYNKTDDPEKQLDAAINGLNEPELNYFQQLYQNEINDLNEYYNE